MSVTTELTWAVGAVGPWATALWAGLALLGVGLLLVTMLNIAYAKLRVEADPVVEALLAALPGANCGGCGLAGCSAYAEAVAKDHGLLGRCAPGGSGVVQRMGTILGISAAAAAPRRAVVHCAAHAGDKTNAARYEGVPRCAEGQMIAGVMGCSYGCLGFGDCVSACPFEAIHMIDGLATVEYRKCVGCGACVKSCPRDLIELLPFQEDPMLVIACSTMDRAKEVRSYCQVGCVGCGLCAKLVPTVFQMKQNLAAIDYEHYGRWAEAAAGIAKCPRAVMVFVGREGVRRAGGGVEAGRAKAEAAAT